MSSNRGGRATGCVLITATKAPGADAIRQAERPAHLRYMIVHRDRIAFGGSFWAGDGSWGGMVVLLDASSLEAAREWLAEEPYCRAGLFADITLRPFRQLLPEPTAGLLEAELSAELGGAGISRPARRDSR